MIARRHKALRSVQFSYLPTVGLGRYLTKRLCACYGGNRRSQLNCLVLNTVMIRDHKWLVLGHVKARTAQSRCTDSTAQTCLELWATLGRCCFEEGSFMKMGSSGFVQKRASFGAVGAKDKIAFII